MPAEVGVRVGGHDAGLTTPPHTVSPPPSPPRLSIPHLICQLPALPDARFGGRDENCGLTASGLTNFVVLERDGRRPKAGKAQAVRSAPLDLLAVSDFRFPR